MRKRILLGVLILLAAGAAVFSIALCCRHTGGLRLGTWVQAAGLLPIGLANAEWGQLATSVSGALSCVVAGGAGLLGAKLMLRLALLRPDPDDVERLTIRSVS